MGVITHGNVRFVDIPEYFLVRYQDHFSASNPDSWPNNLRKIGLVHRIVLKEGYLSDLSPDEELGAQLLAVEVKCRPWPVREGIEILPKGERDREMIARHCEKLQRAGLPANAFTKEPERVGVPFMPDKVWDPPSNAGEGEV